MKRIITSALFPLVFIFTAKAQLSSLITKPENEKNGLSPLVIADNESAQMPQVTNSEWWDFIEALRADILTNPKPKNIFTLLFPDTLKSVYDNSGTYEYGRVRNHSVGLVFCPYSLTMQSAGYYPVKEFQPYTLDSIGIYYNYYRYTGNSTPDTLIVNVYKPQRLLYYRNGSTPRGCSMKYDTIRNKGLTFNEEYKILLSDKDTISFIGRGKGTLFIRLNAFNVTAGSYGNPVAVTWSFKPGYSYSINDTLNSEWNTANPHSALNHFYFWNFTDYQERQIDEWNNGVFIYSWTNEKKYKLETTNGPVYWRGSTFSDRDCYPMAFFKISYDPNWVGTGPLEETGGGVYPNPASNYIVIDDVHAKDVVLYNTLGKIVARSQSCGRQTLNIEDLESGAYLLRYYSGENATTKTVLVR